MLKTQEYLRSGKTLEDLKAEYAIGFRINEALNVACLNYSMIESPMGHEIVQECRALILELDTWAVKAWPFAKFFNYGEGHIPTDFDWDDFRTFEKIDGSLISIWHHLTGWQVASRSVPDGSSLVDDTGLTYRQLVMDTLNDMGVTWDEFTRTLDTHFNYVFELTTPKNQVVCAYSEPRLTLLAVRNMTDLLEEELHLWVDIPTPHVKLYEKFSLEAVQELVQSRNPMEYEGFVLVDKNWNRVKLKGSAYVLMSHQRDGLGKSNKARLELVLSEKTDDVLHILPQYVQDKITELQAKLIALATSIDTVYEGIKDADTQKDFAALATQYKFSGVLFALRSKKISSAMEYFKAASLRSTLDWLSVEDTDSVID